MCVPQYGSVEMHLVAVSKCDRLPQQVISLLVEKVCDIGDLSSEPTQGICNLWVESLPEKWQQFVSKSAASEVRVLVGWVAKGMEYRREM